MQKYGFSENSCRLMLSYLANRRQFTQIGDERSDILVNDFGVPQGSILGPLLFLIYINDLPYHTSTKSLLFADDTTFIEKAKSVDELIENSRINLDRAKSWFVANKLTMNPNKTQNLLITTKNHDMINPEYVKFLGIYIDPNLRWDQHVHFLNKKLCKTAYLLRNLSNTVSQHVLISAYHGLFESNISYGILAWGHSSSADKVFSVQRRVVRIIAGASYRANSTPLFLKLKLLTLPALYVFNCLLYVYKNKHSFITYGDIHTHDTRQKNNMCPKFLRLTKSRHSNYFAVIFFNHLPEEIKILPLDKFKKTIKEILLVNPINKFMDFLTIKW